MSRKAKIIATLGPASRDAATLERLVAAGMNVARLNFSHGTHEQHAEVMATIRRVSEKVGVPVGVLQDLQGPKIRVGDLPAPVQLADREQVILYAEQTRPPADSAQAIPIDFRELFEAVHEGDRLLLDDGRLSLEVRSVKDSWLLASVVVGGVLSAHKGINLPGVRLRIAGFTHKDEQDLKFGIAQGVDAVAVSFVRSAADVKQVKSIMARLVQGANSPLLIAKLEKPEALDELTSILEVVDGVMVARGDLGVELPPEQVPALQKGIIRAANRHNRLVITATEMLESMVSNRLPTRAEASDVANAVFDGTDAVMLSAESAAGKFPVESVQMMDRIICEAESHFFEWGKDPALADRADSSHVVSMARAARALATDQNVAAVASFTMRGQSAWLISKIRPRVPILAFTPEPDTCRRLTFLWGVTPRLAPYVNNLEEMLQHVDAALRSAVQPGNQVVLIFGFPVGSQRPPNMALVHTVGDPSLTEKKVA